jgi:molecular chaperone DnaJ
MAKQDYYEILGVERTATQEDIKKEYRKLAMKFHPDRNTDKSDDEKSSAEESFKAVSEAYEVLSDPNKRAKYNQFGHQENNGASNGFDHFKDMFRRHFHQQQQQQQNNHAQQQIEITLEEANSGCTKRIKYRRGLGCKVCDCTGSKSKSPEQCKSCSGAGQVRREIAPGFLMAETCNACQGKGTRVVDPCEACHGKGIDVVLAEGDIRIPPGMNEHTTIRSANMGHQQNPNLPPGDLLIQAIISEHPRFQRMVDDLACEVEVDVATAILGGKTNIASLEGDTLEVSIPKNSTFGKQLRLREQGMRKLNSKNKGDLYAVIKIVLPKNLTEDQSELLRKFQESLKVEA